ncbi:MAG: DUF4954 family protein [Prevotellaceae bacterium]|jgi:hypothetical protein|nr:DUF4954 family protein [Prevotellaceae bacterium]
MTYRSLTPAEIEILTANHCTADCWDNIAVVENFTPHRVKHVDFSGQIRLGACNKDFHLAGGVTVPAGISEARIHNCVIGNDVYIRRIHNYIANYSIGDGTYIENTNSIVTDAPSTFGNGVLVPVLNENGGREIPIFDFLSAHTAYILTLYRHDQCAISALRRRIDAYAQEQLSEIGTIGKRVRIVNCGLIKNVRIGDCATIGGTSKLKNGAVNSTADAPVQIGSGVKCNDFIISSGVEISDSTLVSRCFIGQGCVMSKHYSALDSLFFSNCQGMHGEATAIFAGPYTVSHHKSSLLIAGMFSFLNAGSGSNQSNHMYKLGPIHQGIAERGSKTTSDSYVLWPAKIGAFTLVMGRHTKHSDTSNLPFSYLIEDASDSFLVPGVNLRSVGTVRDAQKWPKRDNRKGDDHLDQINFNLLSPYTIQKMLRGIEILTDLQRIAGETTDVYTYQNCLIRRSSLLKGIRFYETAIIKFLGNSLISRIINGKYASVEALRRQLKPATEDGLGEWVDLAGLIAPMHMVKALMNNIAADSLSLNEIRDCFKLWHKNYYEYEWTWAYALLLQRTGKNANTILPDDCIKIISEWQKAVVFLDELLYNDAKKEFNLNAQTGFGVDGDDEIKSKDFESVRGNFESNPFVSSILEHVKIKTALGNDAIALLKTIPK